MAFPYLLLGAQAAGIGANLYMNRQASKIESLGYNLDRGEANIKMRQELLIASQQQLSDMRNLQENLATQRAIAGASGVNPGQGSARTIMEASSRAYKEDERIRALNTDFRKGYIESLGRLQRIEQAGLKSNRAAKLISSGLNMFSFNDVYSSGTFKQLSKTLNG